jgi:hypothetical protein
VIATSPFVRLTVREFQELPAIERANYIQRLMAETEARLEWSRQLAAQREKPDNKRW